jgi:hypothetical protein
MIFGENIRQLEDLKPEASVNQIQQMFGVRYKRIAKEK